MTNTTTVPKMSPDQVVTEIQRERFFQDNKHGSIETNGHTIGEWILIMEAELEEAKLAIIKGGDGRNHVLHEILQTVATGFACLEQHGIEPVKTKWGEGR